MLFKKKGWFSENRGENTHFHLILYVALSAGENVTRAKQQIGDI